jgi:streptogramin lyase
MGRRIDSARTLTNALVSVLTPLLCVAATATAQERTWSTPETFAEGTFAGVVPAQPTGVELESTLLQRDFVWVPKTRRNTIVRIDAANGAILGEYRTAPNGASGAPARTAIDAAGNVWVANTDEAANGRGSVVKLGLVIGGTRVRKIAGGGVIADANGEYLAPPFEYCTAVDRDADGLIRTSRGAGHVLDWPSGTDFDGGDAHVQDALDECVLLFQRTSFPNVRLVAIDMQGDVCVGGYGGLLRLDAQSGEVLESAQLACGGYSGAVTSSSVLWTTSFGQGSVLRLDLGSGESRCVAVPTPRGLDVDAQANVWCTTWMSNSIVKITPDGTVATGFPKPSGGGRSDAIVVGPDGHVWVANQSTGNVTRLDANGNLLKRITTGSGPSGIDVDALGRVWVTHLNHHNVVRIDPRGGADGLGAVDLQVALGTLAAPENLGSMAAHVEFRRHLASGSWSVVFDGGREQLPWLRLSWVADVPDGTRIGLAVRAHDDRAALPARAWGAVQNDAESNLVGVVGRFIEIRAELAANDARTASPALRSLLVQARSNEAPDVANVRPSIARLWPPDHRMVPVALEGAVDPDGDPVTITITGITQNEPLTRTFDGAGVGRAVAHLRATRAGTSLNGRAYRIEYAAADGRGGESVGYVLVCVLHDARPDASHTDDGFLWDSTGGLGALAKVSGGVNATQYPNPFNPVVTIRFDLVQAEVVRLLVYDARGRVVRRLLEAQQPAGTHSVRWDGLDEQGQSVPSGVYMYRLITDSSEAGDRLLLLK